MKDYTQYKRIIKFLSSAAIILLQTAVYGAVWIWYYNKVVMGSPFWRRGNWLMIAVYAILLMFFEQMYGGFKVGFYKKWNVIYSQILSLAIVNVITYLQIALIDKRFHSPATIGMIFLAEVVLAVLWAFGFQFLYSRLFPQRRMLLVYGERPAFHLMQKISTREDKYQICNIIHFKEGIEEIMQLAHQYDAIIIGDIPAHERNLLLKMCFGKGLRTYTVPKISDIINRSSDDLNLFDTPLLLSRNEGLKIEQLICKRVMDIFCSLLGIIAASPFFLVIAVLIRATDRGPVFYRQIRLTQDGREFMIYKFRTMIQNAEKDGQARLAAEGDSRVLPVGRFLRATRLDELPQLFNVLKGEMSMVGPRPERPELAAEIAQTLPEFPYRLKVKAGLTGYAQIYGKYNTTAYDKLKLDLTYIRNYSLILDLKLMIMTPKVMLMKESTEGVMDEDVRLQSQEVAAAKIDIKLNKGADRYAGSNHGRRKRNKARSAYKG